MQMHKYSVVAVFLVIGLVLGSVGSQATEPIPKNVELVSAVTCLGVKKHPSGQPYCVGIKGRGYKYAGRSYTTFRLEDSIWILAKFRNLPKGNYVLETKCSSSTYPKEKPGHKNTFISDGSINCYVWFPVKYNDRYDVVGTHKVSLILGGRVFGHVKYTVEKYLPARIVGKAMSKGSENVTTYYNNGYCSVGTIERRSIIHKKIKYTLPPGKSYHEIVDIAMDSRERLFVWFKDRTYGIGPSIVPATKIDLYSPDMKYSLPQGKTPYDIVGMAIDPYNDVYVWFRNGTFCKGTAFNLDKPLESYEPIWRGGEPIDGMAIDKSGRVLTWAASWNSRPMYIGTSNNLNLYETNNVRTIKGEFRGFYHNLTPPRDVMHEPKGGY